MKCNKCGEQMEAITDEVDIGVGVQTHVRGYDCKCGNALGVCDGCGALSCDPCRDWCELMNREPHV